MALSASPPLGVYLHPVGPKRCARINCDFSQILPTTAVMPDLPEPAGAVVPLLRPTERAEPLAPDAAHHMAHAAHIAHIAPALAPRKRPRPGERRVQILQTLAAMLEQPGADRITTAALAARLQVSEAALYRHFASKAQMFDGLIEFIESSVFTLVKQITERDPPGPLQAQRIVVMLLQFGEKNPGMVRVMVGDALVFEHERLILRMNQFFDRVEGQLQQCLRATASAVALAAAPGAADSVAPGAALGLANGHGPATDAAVLASGLTALVVGRLQRFARSGFRRCPTEHLDSLLARWAV